MTGLIDIKELKTEIMSTTKKEKMMTVKVKAVSVTMPNHQPKAADKMANPVVCPRCVDEVYSLGISLEEYLGRVYLELAELNKGKKNPYTNLLLDHLGIKKGIEELAKDNLDQLLTYFYENGGPIIEKPVSELTAREIQPFFNRVVTSFLDQMDFVWNKAYQGKMSASDLNNQINEHIVAMYTSMGKLFRNEEMQNAFNELIYIGNIRK